MSGLSVGHFEALNRILLEYNEIVITPQIAAETSNLIRYMDSPAREQVALFYRAFLQSNNEHYVVSACASDREEYIRLGLTDAVLLNMAHSGAVLITIDTDLHVAALSAGYETVQLNWLLG